jgi:muramoyltetrapeptide carboxypeptidase LdcA involved in peptidoglycan recycling
MTIRSEGPARGKAVKGKASFRKPPRLKSGDTVAVLSPSAGLPHVFPRVYENGLKNLKELFGLRTKEYPTTRASPEHLYLHPELRARDFSLAIRDPDVSAVIASIGGDDSFRVLGLLPSNIFDGPPKVIMGYSDATTLLTVANQRGWVTMHGPSVMAGFSQATALPATFRDHLRTVLFEGPDEYEFRPYGRWSDGYPDFGDPLNVGKVKQVHLDPGWHWLQGVQTRRGRFFGGCFQLLQLLNGTRYWPRPSFWNGKILFMETSEEKPTPAQVAFFLRTLGLQGIFDRIEALLLGRARDYSLKEKSELDRVAVRVVGGEFHHPEMPIVSNVDFGHTDPQLIIPLGGHAEIDPERRRIRLLEPVVS